MFSRLSRIKMIHKAGAIAFAAALFLMPGCSGKNADIPELMAPVVMNESFGPVSYGDVGTLEYRDAMVVPTTYGHFFETATYVSEIYVELGQYVEEELRGEFLVVNSLLYIQLREERHHLYRCR